MPIRRQTPSGRTPRRAQPMLPLPVRNAGQPIRKGDTPVTATCGGCSAQWSDPETTHCRVCHATWQNVQGFDAHLADCQPRLATRSGRGGRR
ncbi:hypothetical protein FsymDg_0651 [Candidatus Protofrankia datiscae]|uniref:Phage FDXHR zinc binding domain-containing protein n=3 Tax=Frankiaceae TaxID=74712 RepID=F8AV84_9ACTN|nr:hypothetical protein FsymDg_0651 [Candidatus Protofrankia datiscae]KLL10857.1 hypothetical protein FrCorBMG51_15030 [Protofrankia coriariae]ONH38163.1 hypothetical protein BL254_01765 [Protofrankia sp. BMG5.30]